jgi:mannitol-specific phosphotransferase system IIBC component
VGWCRCLAEARHSCRTLARAPAPPGVATTVAKVAAKVAEVSKVMVARVVHLLLGHLVGRHLVGHHQAEVGAKVVVEVVVGEEVVVVVVEEVIHHLVGHLMGANG